MQNTSEPGSRKIFAYTCLALSMSLVGSYVAVSKPLAAVFPVFLLAWMRFGIGVVAMVNWLKFPVNEPALTLRIHVLIFLESFFGNFLFTLCMIYGVKLTSAAAAGVAMAAIPAAVAVMSWLFLNERVQLKTWLAVGCAGAGISLFFAAMQTPLPLPASNSGELLNTNAPVFGQIVLLGAVLCEAAYSVIGKRLTSSIRPHRIACLINVWGFLMAAPLGLHFAMQFNFAAVSWKMWGLLLFYALAASVWSVWLWMTGLRIVPAAEAGIFTVCLPISAAVVGVLVLGELLTPLQWMAFGIALSSVVLATLPNACRTSVFKK